MSLRDRWIRFLHKAATGTRRTRTLLTPVGIAIFAAFTTAFVLAALLVDRVLKLPSLLVASWRLPLAIFLALVGLAVTGWSVRHFLRVKGTPVPFNPPPELVDTGPYHYARNPMLTGVFLILFALGLAVDSFSLVIFFTPLYILTNVWELKAIEEPELLRRLGDEYDDYRQHTPMFFPRITKRRG